MTAPAKKLVSTDFNVGQTVICTNADQFQAPKDRYLKNRTGEVVRVLPVTRPDEFYCGHTNMVEVLWHQRLGRGVQKRMLMNPRDIMPLWSEDAADATKPA